MVQVKEAVEFEVRFPDNGLSLRVNWSSQDGEFYTPGCVENVDGLIEALTALRDRVNEYKKEKTDA